MQRRRLLQHAVTAGSALALAASARAAEPPTSREFYELRSYHLRAGQRERFGEFLGQALLPALARAQAGPVGVFDEVVAQGDPVVWLLLPHRDAAGPATLASRLTEDKSYLSAASELLPSPTTDAVYDHVESSLLAAIDAMPRMEAPESGPRIFNLRIYESFNAATLNKKLEMFHQGELAIFRRVGLTPVLFSKSLLGPRLPSLTYLLTFPDDAARQSAWQTFRGDPEWRRMKAIPEYADARLVSRITNKVLTPAEGSQV